MSSWYSARLAAQAGSSGKTSGAGRGVPKEPPMGVQGTPVAPDQRQNGFCGKCRVLRSGGARQQLQSSSCDCMRRACFAGLSEMDEQLWSCVPL